MSRPIELTQQERRVLVKQLEAVEREYPGARRQLDRRFPERRAQAA